MQNPARCRTQLDEPKFPTEPVSDHVRRADPGPHAFRRRMKGPCMNLRCLQTSWTPSRPTQRTFAGVAGPPKLLAPALIQRFQLQQSVSSRACHAATSLMSASFQREQLLPPRSWPAAPMPASEKSWGTQCPLIAPKMLHPDPITGPMQRGRSSPNAEISAPTKC